jgi:Protein of unknown function (DUF3142)
MRPALHFTLPMSRIARVGYAAILVTSISVAAAVYKKPWPWSVGEVPVAFWAWRTQAPDQADIREAIQKAKAHAVFLRAGQIDYDGGKLRRIRPLAGKLPQGVHVHLVYNATRKLLEQLETVDPNLLATTIALAFRNDSARAEQDNANLRGLQLDIDVPTRLLTRYEKTLTVLRNDLQSDLQLSITGLPTWMESSALHDVLKQVDFWVPQFYGGEIPQRLDQMIPISSPEATTRFVNKARELDRPFYAGLAAYSFALLYSPSGALISLRGDMDPAAIAADPNLELIDSRAFDTSTNKSPMTEWRYAFRAKADGVTEGLNMRGGDVLVVDLPSSESLRVAARIVRERAGKRLLGICVFRLPDRDDPATLTLEQVGSALSDQDSLPQVDVRIRREQPAGDPSRFIFECKNIGTASPLLGSLRVAVAVPPGSLPTITSESVTAVELRCQGTEALPQPCSPRRANLISFTPRALVPGQTLSAFLILSGEPPPTLKVSITMQTDTGQSYSVQREVSTEVGVNQ